METLQLLAAISVAYLIAVGLGVIFRYRDALRSDLERGQR